VQKKYSSRRSGNCRPIGLLRLRRSGSNRGVDFLAAQERRREALERLQALRDQLPPAEITEGEMQEIVDTVREVRAQNRAERERAGRP
jgi:hypothetical protein